MQIPYLRARLSLLMFLQFLVWGSWMVTLGTYLLHTLHFSGRQVGMVYATTAIAATVSPLWLGVLADRFFAAERLLSILHLLGALLLLGASMVSGFGWFYVLMLLYTLCYMPTFSLSNALCFHHLDQPGRTFPHVRVWGTIAWIVAGVMLSYLGIESEAAPLRLSAGFSVVLGLYCLSLPHTPPRGKKTGSLADLRGAEVRQLFRDRSFAVLILALGLICIPSAYYYSFVNPFLNEIGVDNAAGKMAIGQGVEILIVLAMPWFLSNWPFRWIIFTGLLVWGLRYAAFALGETTFGAPLLYFGIAVQGFAYGFTSLAAQIYVDSRVPPSLKGTAQGFIAFLTLGLGAFVGSYIAGASVSLFQDTSGGHQWPLIWIIPSAVGFVVAFAFLIGFRNGKPASRPL